MEAITVNNLKKSFKSKIKTVDVLNGMSFTVDKGEILGFLGPNGAGKSTTIKILMDLVRADSGTAKICGIDSTNIMARQKVGFMPENPQYFDTLSGYELLMLSASIFNVNKELAKDISWKLLKEFDLEDAAKRPIRTYSKGMIQRIGFASTLIHSPRILILDEPMSGLDPIGRVLFKNKMLELNKDGVVIFFSSHIIPDIEDVCTKVLIVNKGKVLKSLDKNKIRYLTTTGFDIIINKKLCDLKTKKIGEDLYKLYCPKEKLLGILESIKNLNVDIVDIEPVRKDLESIFLEANI